VLGPRRDLDGVLGGSPLFARVDDRTLAQYAGLLGLRRYRKVETVFHQGDAGDALERDDLVVPELERLDRVAER
jgi:hypothetical protein